MLFFRSLIARLTLLAGLLAPGAGCKGSKGKDTSQGEERGPRTVNTVRPKRQDLRRVFEQPGFIEAFEETPIFARVPGKILENYRDIGDPLRGPRYDKTGKKTAPGQVLAELWVPEMVEEVKQKRAMVELSRAAVEQATAALAAAEAGIQTAKALVREAEAARTRALAHYERWDSESKRINDLVRRNVIDKQTRDETLNQFKAAGAARQEVEAKILSARAAVLESAARRNKARADLAAAKAHVHVARAEEGKATALLRYATIRAPYDGIVTRRNVNTDSFVQPANGNGGKPLFVVARTDVVRIFAEVPEADALLVHNGLPVRIHVQADRKGLDFAGKVKRSAWSLDPKSRTLRTEIDLSNPGGLLRPGMYAYVTFTAKLSRRLTLPASAILTEAEQPVCFLVEDNKVVRRTPVRLGVRVGGLVEVLKKQGKPARPGEERPWVDFTVADVVVKDKLTGLTDGQRVKVAHAGN